MIPLWYAALLLLVFVDVVGLALAELANERPWRDEEGRK